MFSFWGSRDQKDNLRTIETQQECIDNQATIIENLTNELQEARQEVTKLKDEIDNFDIGNYASTVDTMMFVLTATQPDPVKGLQVSMDWNEEFLKYLVANNVMGDVEEELIQKWLVMLCEGMINDIEDSLVEAASNSVGEDYV